MIAQEALDKQTPAKPKIYKSHPDDLYLCPSCGSTFIKNHFGVLMNYCPNCGQRIDKETV